MRDGDTELFASGPHWGDTNLLEDIMIQFYAVPNGKYTGSNIVSSIEESPSGTGFHVYAVELKTNDLDQEHKCQIQRIT